MKNYNTTLLVIDVQNFLFDNKSPIYEVDKFIKNINSLIDKARKLNTPIFYIQHNNKISVKGSKLWQINSQIIQPAKNDVIMQKWFASSFQKTTLKEELHKRKIKQIVVAGLVSFGCVRAACLDGLRLGFNVVLAEDAHSCFGKDAKITIAKWNNILKNKGVTLKQTKDIFI